MEPSGPATPAPPPTPAGNGAPAQPGPAGHPAAAVPDAAELLSLVLRSARLGLCAWERQTDRLRWSQSPPLEGLDSEALPATLDEAFRMIHPDDRPRVRTQALAAWQQRAAELELDLRVVLPGGAVRSIRALGRLCRDGAGNPTGFTGTLEDRTRQLRTEAALRASEEWARLTVDNALDAVILADTQGSINAWNERAEATFGWTREEALGKNLGELVIPERYREAHKQGLTRYLATGQSGILCRRMEVEGQSKDGRIFPIELSVSALHGADGLEGFCAHIRDLTERMKADDALRESESRLKAVVENTPNVAIQGYDLEGRILFWNRASEGLFGFEAAQALGKTLDQLIHTPQEAEAFRRVLHQIHQTGQAVGPTEYRFRRSDGREGHCLSTTFAITGTGERPAFVCMDVDITERKLAEDSLRRSEERLRGSEERYRTLVEHAPEALVVLDVDKGHFVDANRHAMELFHLSREELLKRGPAELSAPFTSSGRPAAEAAAEFIQNALAGHQPAFEWIHRDAQGKDIPCEVRLVRLPSENQRLIRGSILDISEKKKLEEQLREAQKVESIGRLAGGIAHDFNNLLTSIMGFADLAAAQAHPDTPLKRNLGLISEAALRGGNLTRQLLTFARKQVTSPQTLDLNQILQKSGQFLGRLIGEDIELRILLGTDLEAIRIDPGQLEQVIINLAVNARDAMPRGGTLTFQTSLVRLGEEIARANLDLPAGPYVQLAVTDTGCGMTPEVRARIFEPFFTTKPVGMGTGLGLATCHGIIRQNHGHISVQTEPGKGCTFRICLPAVPKAASAPKSDIQAVPTPHARETILLVEDDEMIRTFVTEALQTLGYTMLTAKHGEEALALATATPEPLHLLLTDVVMPRMGGYELAERLTAQRPKLKVLYISGYTGSSLLQQGAIETDNIQLLPKPFTRSALVQKVREILDAPAPPKNLNAPINRIPDFQV